MRKAQDRMEASRPYAEHIRTVIGHLRMANPDSRVELLQERPEIRRIGYIVISTDRGLCGGLNANMFRSLLSEIGEWQAKGVEVDLCLMGRKARQRVEREFNSETHYRRIMEIYEPLVGGSGPGRRAG